MVVIIDYNMGNIASVKKALLKLGAEAKISRDAADINLASHVILPGVGAFGQGIENIRNLGLEEVLRQKVLKEKRPFLGVCLGMQLLADTGYEFGQHKGLGFIAGETVEFQAPNIRLPHVGWNNIEIVKPSPLLEDLPDKNFYFVHSFHLKCKDPSVVTSVCDYGEGFVATIESGNIFGAQFHPEKSQDSGLKVLKNFLDYKA